MTQARVRISTERTSAPGRRRLFERSEAGFGTVAALGFVLVLLTLGATAAPVARVQLQKTAAIIADKQAFYLADSGVSSTIAWMQQHYAPANADLYFDITGSPVTYEGANVTLPGHHPDPYVDTSGTRHTGIASAFAGALSAQSLGAGTSGAEATLISSVPERWEVHSTGNVGGHAAELVAIIERTRQVLFSGAVFGDHGVTMNGTPVVDSYDSTAGPYGGANVLLAEADLGSNRDIELAGDAVVHGDASPGPGHEVTLKGNAVVTGSSEASASAHDVPAVLIPPDAVSLGSIDLTGNATQTITAGSYRVDGISVHGGAQLAIDSAAGPVIVYVTGAVEIGGRGVVNLRGDPRGFSLFGATGAPVTISGSSDFHGAIYAPESTLAVCGTGDLYGAFVGRRITISGTGAVHYDRSLADRSAPGSFRLISWQRML